MSERKDLTTLHPYKMYFSRSSDDSFCKLNVIFPLGVNLPCSDAVAIQIDKDFAEKLHKQLSEYLEQ